MSVDMGQVENADIATSEDGIRKEETSDAPLSDPRQGLHGLKWFLCTVAILSTTLLFALDTTIVANVQPSIVQRFGGVEKLPWLGAAFALGSAATILPWSKIYGLYNVKFLYVGHIVVFETGSALCGGAPTLNALIVGRAIAGLGASGMYVGCLTYISVLTSVQERPMYMGLIGLVWGIGTILGPVIGGLFIDSSATWRWAFYINLVVGAVFAPIILLLLPSIDLRPNVSLLAKLKQYTDWLGIIIFAAAISVFIMAITFGGTVFDWSSGSEIALWALTGVFGILFCLTQTFSPLVEKDFGLYPTKLMKRPTLLMLQIAIFMAATGLLVPTYYIPLFFQFTRGSSALSSAVHLLPFIIMIVLFSLVNGALMAKYSFYWPWYFSGGALVLTGASLMYTITSHSASSNVYGYTVLIGAGTGLFLQAGFTLCQALVSPEEVTDAIGFMSLAQSLGIVVSLAIAGSIFENQAIAHVRDVLPDTDEQQVKNAVTGTNGELFNTLDVNTRSRVISAIVNALSSVYLVVLVAGVTVFFISICIVRNKAFIDPTSDTVKTTADNGTDDAED